MHSTALDPDEAWGHQAQARCGCGASVALWAKRCPACRKRQPFSRLVRKRRRVERWIDGQVDAEILPALQKANLVLDSVRQYQQVLDEARRRPVPARQRREKLVDYHRRLVAFFPTLLSTTAPTRVAQEIADRLPRTAAALARIAADSCERILSSVSGLPPKVVAEAVLEPQAARIERDLETVVAPYLEALTTVKLYHDRVVIAFKPVLPILQRGPPSGFFRALWARLREGFSPAGKLLRFGTAVWKNSGEREQLGRLEKELLLLHQQVGRFARQTAGLEQRESRLRQVYRLSLRKHLVARLRDQATTLNPEVRAGMVHRLLSQKGVGSWLWRMFSRRSPKS
jgi:hypothetical protein